MTGPATTPPGSASIRHADDTLRLLDEHGRGLFALLWRLTSRTDVADDLLQELTVKLASSDTFAAADLPLAFARRAATNLALDWRRARVRREALLDGYAAACPPEPTPADAALAGMIEQEDLTRVLDALASLREPDRVLLTLRHLEEQAFDEIAAALGTTAHRARARTPKRWPA